MSPGSRHRDSVPVTPGLITAAPAGAPRGCFGATLLCLGIFLLRRISCISLWFSSFSVHASLFIAFQPALSVFLLSSVFPFLLPSVAVCHPRTSAADVGSSLVPPIPRTPHPQSQGTQPAKHRGPAGNSSSLAVWPGCCNSPRGTMSCDSPVPQTAPGLSSVSPDSRGCPGPGNPAGAGPGVEASLGLLSSLQKFSVGIKGAGGRTQPL